MLVAGIVSAFAGTASYLNERKKRKAEKAQEKIRARKQQARRARFLSELDELAISVDRFQNS